MSSRVSGERPPEIVTPSAPSESFVARTWIAGRGAQPGIGIAVAVGAGPAGPIGVAFGPVVGTPVGVEEGDGTLVGVEVGVGGSGVDVAGAEMFTTIFVGVAA